MENLVAQYKKGEDTIKVFQDEFVNDPRRDYDHIGNMQFYHSKYCLGDKRLYNIEDYSSFDAMIEKNHADDTILNVYMYDHSGLTISTSPFSCQWDSGQLGFIFISKADIIANWGEHTTETVMKAVECMESEVKEYESYLRGECYLLEIQQGDEEPEIYGGVIGDYHEHLKCEVSDFSEYQELTP
jgi:hypothetical protein